MSITTLHCPARDKRIPVDTRYDDHRDANALLADPPRRLARCVGCPVGRRNRARFARDGMRISLTEIDPDRRPRVVSEMETVDTADSPSYRGFRTVD